MNKSAGERARKEFPAEYELLFAMPDASLSLYLDLSLEKQKEVNHEILEAIRNKILLKDLKKWDNQKVSTDQDGFRNEEDVRQELNQLVSKIGRAGVRLTVSDREGLILTGSKHVKCGQDFRFEYPIRISEREDSKSRPWIIPSTLVRGIVFGMRVSVHWMGPELYRETEQEKDVARPEETVKPPQVGTAGTSGGKPPRG